MRRFVVPVAAVALASLVAAACASSEGSSAPAATDAGLASDAAAPLSYRTHIAPMIEQRCNGCHYEGGSAPFALTSYARVSELAPTLEASCALELHEPRPVTLVLVPSTFGAGQTGPFSIELASNEVLSCEQLS
jgi:hypothetical protein